jgi:hypothetical protein
VLEAGDYKELSPEGLCVGLYFPCEYPEGNQNPRRILSRGINSLTCPFVPVLKPERLPFLLFPQPDPSLHLSKSHSSPRIKTDVVSSIKSL